MKVYKLAKGWLYLLVFICSVLTIAALTGLVLIVKDIASDPGKQENWIFMACLLVGILFLIYAMLSCIKSKLVLGADRFEYYSAFGKHELLFTDVKGFKTDDKYTRIYPQEGKGKKMLVSTYYADSLDLQAWLGRNFQDMDLAERELEEQQILNDVTFGQSPEERALALKHANKVALAINATGIILAAFHLFDSNFMHYSLVATAVFVPVSLLVLKFYKGLIRIETKKSSPYPSIFFGFTFSIMGIALKSILAFEILDYSKLWTPAALIALCLMALLVVKSKEFEQISMQRLFILIFCAVLSFAYAFGSISSFNCIYDNSEVTPFTAKVLNKRISSGKSTSYYLILSPWGPVNEVEDVYVAERTYRESEIGDEVNLFLYKGRLELPWFILSTK